MATKNDRKNIDVYVYRRWSDDKQTDGDSGRRQHDRAEDWCRGKKLKITAEETDDGISAFRGKNRRPGSGLDRLINRLKPGDYLLVEDHDRLTREDWLTGMNLVADIVGRGAILVTLSNGNEIDAERFRRDPGCFLPAILKAHLGHDEDNKKAARVRDSWAKRKTDMAAGKPANLHLPCWLDWEGQKQNGKPVLVESNARVIRKMFSLASQGMGSLTIARKLHQDGDKLVDGERVLSLTGPYVWNTLRNKLCIGYGVYVEPPTPDVYPPVIPESLFFAVQARLDTNRHQTAPRSKGIPSLFTGLLFCRRCGGHVCRHTQFRNNRTYEYVVCSDALHKVAKCGLASLRHDWLEQSFLSLLAHGLLMRMILSDKQEGPSALDELRGRRADATARAQKYFEMIDKDPTPSPRLKAAFKAAEAMEAELKAQIEAEQARTKVPAVQAYDACCDLFGRGLHPEARSMVREALRDFVEEIVVHLGDDLYEVHFKGARMPIQVEVNCNGWTFNPAPTVAAYLEKAAALGIS